MVEGAAEAGENGRSFPCPLNLLSVLTLKVHCFGHPGIHSQGRVGGMLKVSTLSCCL